MRELIFSTDGTGHLALPDRCSINVSCFGQQEVQEAVAQALKECLYVAALAGIDLTALDGITVASDCQAAARSLQDLPAGQVPLEMSPQPGAMEVGRTAAVQRYGSLRFHIVVRCGLGLLAISPDQQMQRVAQACVAHEAAHVEHESHLYRMFPESYGRPLECGKRSRQTFLKAMDVWSEYAACRSSAVFRPEALEEFEGLLCRALEESAQRALELIEAQRAGHLKNGEVFRKVQQIFGDLFINAGYLLGHIHGLERRRKECTPRLDLLLRAHSGAESLIKRLEDELQQLWLQEFSWPSIEIFVPIYDLICEYMEQRGLVFVRQDDEWRIVTYDRQEEAAAARKPLTAWK